MKLIVQAITHAISLNYPTLIKHKSCDKITVKPKYEKL